MIEIPTHAVIVSSCDGYSDAWEPFFKLFFTYWPDCPYKIYLVSETKEYPDGRVLAIHNPDRNWSRVIRSAFEKIPEEYVVYLQEDYFLTSKIDTAKISEFLGILKKEQAACVRLAPAPGPNEHFNKYSEIGLIRPGSPYRLSLQPALWNKKIFHDLIIEGESPWEAEEKGSGRTDAVPQAFLGVYSKKIFPYIATAIVKGRWTYDALYFCKKNNIPLDTTRRGIEPYAQYIRRRLSSLPIIGGAFKLGYKVKKKLKRLFLSK